MKERRKVNITIGGERQKRQARDLIPRGIGHRCGIFVLALLLAAKLGAQQDTLPKWRLSGKACLLWSRPFSNYPLGKQEDESSSTRYRASDTTKHYFPGYLFGLEFHFPPERGFMLLLGASLAHSRASYHATYISVSQTARPGFTQLTKTTETDVQLKYTALNLQAGTRFRLYPQVYCSLSFLLNNPLRILRAVDSSVESLYSNSSGGTDRQFANIHEPETKLGQKPANLSFMLGFDYSFRTGDIPSTLSVFRNFGMIYALPWWGLGYAISLDNGY